MSYYNVKAISSDMHLIYALTSYNYLNGINNITMGKGELPSRWKILLPFAMLLFWYCHNAHA